MMNIIPFHADMIPEAATLLAARHQRDRIVFPELPPRFEDPLVASKAIESALKRNQASGVAAMDGERLVAYMLGDVLISNVWGRTGWVRPAGCALASDQLDGLIGDLYAILGERWKTVYGCLDHFVQTPIADPTWVNAWFMLSFGVQQVHALKALDNIEPSDPPTLPGIEIRKSEPRDREVLADMSDVIWRHQIKAPVWAIMPPENVAETREGWAELVDDPTVAVYLAFYEGQAVASQAYFPAETADDDLLIPDRCARFTVAGSRESVRGMGIQNALMQHALVWLKENNYQYCETDWRSTNLLASRTWPRHGYKPVAYRLHRRLDPRSLWAKGLD